MVSADLSVSSVPGTVCDRVKTTSPRASLFDFTSLPLGFYLPSLTRLPPDMSKKFEYTLFLLHFTLKEAARSLGVVCHTPVHKRLHLSNSWCGKCAVIARSHMDLGVFGISSQICSSAVHVIMTLPTPPPPPLIFSPFRCLLGLLCCVALAASPAALLVGCAGCGGV